MNNNRTCSTLVDTSKISKQQISELKKEINELRQRIENTENVLEDKEAPVEENLRYIESRAYRKCMTIN